MKTPHITILSPVAHHREPMNQRTIEMIANVAPTSLFGAHGYSEVDRARIVTASAAAPHVEKHGGLVLWLDSDMVVSEDTIRRHAEAVLETKRAISGRYVRRMDPQRLAATIEEDNPLIELTIDRWNLFQVLAGMGALMMEAEVFLEQLHRSPVEHCADGSILYLCCTSQIIKHKARGNVLLSEDLAYCRSLPGGVYYATDREGRQIDYGHIITRPAYPEPTAHTVEGA